MEARKKDDRYKQKVEKAYLLWEADGKPQGKWDHYCKLAEEKLREEERIVAEEKLREEERIISEEKLKEKQLPAIYKPYYFLEKRILEPADAWMSRQAFITILGRLSNIAVIAAVLSFVFGENYRRNDEIFAAWTTITTAGDQPGSGGRIEALEFLNSRPLKFPWIGWTKPGLYWDESNNECKVKRLWGTRWERQSLNGLSAPNSYLEKIHLCDANLFDANLQNADLKKANLEYASLRLAKLQGVNLFKAKLQGVTLFGAKLQYANLNEAKLQYATLVLAKLQDAKLNGTNLQNAYLIDSNLKNAELNGANLQNAYLNGANLQDAELNGAKNLTTQQVKSACNWEQAKFSKEFKKKLEQEPDQEVYCSMWD